MQNNLKSLQSKIMDLENKLNRVNVEDTGNSMQISGMEHSSILGGPGNTANIIRDIQIPNQQQQQMPTPILKNKENNVPPLSPTHAFNYKDGGDPYNEARGGFTNSYNNTGPQF